MDEAIHALGFCASALEVQSRGAWQGFTWPMLECVPCVGVGNILVRRQLVGVRSPLFWLL